MKIAKRIWNLDAIASTTFFVAALVAAIIYFGFEKAGHDEHNSLMAMWNSRPEGEREAIDQEWSSAVVTSEAPSDWVEWKGSRNSSGLDGTLIFGFIATAALAYRCRRTLRRMSVSASRISHCGGVAAEAFADEWQATKPAEQLEAERLEKLRLQTLRAVGCAENS